MTTLLLTKIPHFREVILMAFECPHCGLRNNEIQSGQAIAEKGANVSCSILNAKVRNRQRERERKRFSGRGGHVNCFLFFVLVLVGPQQAGGQV